MKRQYLWCYLRGGSTTTPTNWADNIFGIDHGVEIYEPPPPVEQSSSSDTFIPPAVDTDDRPPTLYEEQVRMYPDASEEDLTSMTIEKSRYDTSSAIGDSGSNYVSVRVRAYDSDDEEHDEGSMGGSDDEDHGYVAHENDVKRFSVETVSLKGNIQKAMKYDAEIFKDFKNVIIYLKDTRAPVGLIIVVIAHKSLSTEEIRTCMALHQEHTSKIEGPNKGKTDLYYLVNILAEYTNLDHRTKYYKSDIYSNIDKNIFINDWEMYDRHVGDLFKYNIVKDKSFFINDVICEAAQIFNFRYYNYVPGIENLFKVAKLPGGSIKAIDQPKKAESAAAEEEIPIPTPTPTPTETTGEQIIQSMEQQDEQPTVTTILVTDAEES